MEIDAHAAEAYRNASARILEAMPKKKDNSIVWITTKHYVKTMGMYHAGISIGAALMAWSYYYLIHGLGRLQSHTDVKNFIFIEACCSLFPHMMLITLWFLLAFDKDGDYE